MKIVKAIVWLLLLILLTFNVYSFVSIRVLGNELAVVGGKALVEVISGSMEPTIKVGDMIVIDTEAKEFKNKDIITFRDAAGSFVTHRIIEVTEDGFATKGDNNDSVDNDLVTKDNIVGRYVLKISGLGIIIGALKNPITFVIILLIGIILCFIASTDKDGKPVDVDDDYLEFLSYRNKKKKGLIKDIDNKENDINSDDTKKNEVKKSSSKNSVSSKNVSTKKVKVEDSDTKKTTSNKAKPSTNKNTKNGSTAKEKRADNISTTKKKNLSGSSGKSRTNTKK